MSTIETQDGERVVHIERTDYQYIVTTENGAKLILNGDHSLVSGVMYITVEEVYFRDYDCNIELT